MKFTSPKTFLKGLSPIIIVCFSWLSYGQQLPASTEDSAAILRTAMDYIEGYYSGDADRVERAIHPDLNKATPRDLPQTGRTALNYTTWSGLIEFTKAKAGVLADTARHINAQILNLENDVANVKIISAQYTDYIQVVKLNDQWKIINVLFTSGLKTPPRLKNFDPDKEKPEIGKSALTYLNAISAADAGRLDLSIDPEFNRVTIQPVGTEGKQAIRRQRYESLVESTMAGIGKQDEVYRNNSVTVLDVTDGIAIVRCGSTGFIDYVQMYKGDGTWKILNSVSRPNTSLTLLQAMTAIAGEPMPDFNLPVYGGGNFKLSDYKGKNVMLIFPRGWTGNNWCSYCPYQYLELEKLEKEKKILEKNNLKVAFVMPYGSERIKDWMEKFPDGIQVIEGLKNPQQPPAPGTIQAEYIEWVKQHFPLVFEVKKDDPHTIIPVLVDEDRTLSRQLKLFTNFWDGVSAEQNIASVFIIDKKGILKYKYIGQMTEDRPDIEFLLEVVKDQD